MAALFVARKLAPHRRRSLPLRELHRTKPDFTGLTGLGGVVAATGRVAGSLPAPAPTPPLTSPGFGTGRGPWLTIPLSWPPAHIQALRAAAYRTEGRTCHGATLKHSGFGNPVARPLVPKAASQPFGARDREEKHRVRQQREGVAVPTERTVPKRCAKGLAQRLESSRSQGGPAAHPNP